MKSKKNDKLINRVLVIIIVLLVILTIVNLIIVNKSKDSNNNEFELQSHSNQAQSQQIDNNLVRPTFYGYVFQAYNGEYSQNDIIKATNVLAIKVIPEFYKNLSNKSDIEIKKYFDEKKFIQNGKSVGIENTNIGIQNEKALKQLIKTIEKIIIPTANMDFGLSFDKDTIQSTNEGTKVTLKIQYITNKDSFPVNILIKDKDENGVIIEICE